MPKRTLIEYAGTVSVGAGGAVGTVLGGAVEPLPPELAPVPVPVPVPGSVFVSGVAVGVGVALGFLTFGSAYGSNGSFSAPSTRRRLVVSAVSARAT